MYSFEGEYRRRPTQQLSGSSTNQSRDELIRAKQEGRRLREIQRQKEHTIASLQRYSRGFLARQRTADLIRDVVDKALSKDTITPEEMVLSIKLLFRVFDVEKDQDRLASLSQYCLQKNAQVLASITDAVSSAAFSMRMSQLLLENFKSLEKHTDAPLMLPLRLVEVYACSDALSSVLWVNLVKGGLFVYIRNLILTRCPEVDSDFKYGDTRCSPLSESLMSIVTKCLTCCTDPSDKAFLVNHLLMDFFGYVGDSNSIDCRLYFMFLPHINKCSGSTLSANNIIDSAKLHSSAGGRSNIWRLHAFVSLIVDRLNNLPDANVVSYLSVLRVQLLDVLKARARLQRLHHSHDDDSSSEDEEESMDAIVEQNVMATEAFDSLWKRINCDNHVQVVMTAVDRSKSFEALMSISSICYAVQKSVKHALHRCQLLYKMAFNPSLLHLLWTTIENYSTTGPPKVPMLQVLSSGMVPDSCWEEVNAFLPLLMSFCSLFGHLLPTIHESEFFQEINDEENGFPKDSGCNMMPFSLVELSQIATRLRDVVLGLVELAFPEVHRQHTVATELPDNEDMWTSLFTSVVSLLKQLYQRDRRRQYCDSWLIPESRVNLHQISDSTLQTPFLARKPFTTSQKKSKERFQEEGPLRSLSELRSVTIVQELPFIISFNARVRMIDSLVKKDREIHSDPYNHMDVVQANNIRRNFLYEDAFERLGSDRNLNLKKKLRVSMRNVLGADEAGIDGGGVMREFLSDVLKTAFDLNRGFFKTTSDNLYYPNPAIHLLEPNFAQHYFFIGRMLGKAIYEHMLVELPLAGFFLQKILARHSQELDIHHLASLDPVLYKNLLYLKTYDGDVSELGLDFVVVTNDLGENQAVELKPGGTETPVTNENRIEYVHLVADYKLNKQIRAQTNAFRQGFFDVISPHWLQLFDAHELQMLISGQNSQIDIDDWQTHTSYGTGLEENHPVIQCFWRVVRNFSEEDKRKLLKFTTSCSRPPLLGFKELYPPFAINSSGPQADRLPTSSTCMNLLKLPEIVEYEVMKDKLLYAIQSQTGFELS